MLNCKTFFLRIKDVMKKTGIAKSTIWLWVSEGKFPKPIKLSPRITVWDEISIEQWKKEKNLSNHMRIFKIKIFT